VSELKLTSKIISGELMYLDELNKDHNVWIPKSKLSKYIFSTYMMLDESYFRVVMENRGITDYDKCSICGKTTSWINIFNGYATTCGVSCRNKYISNGNPNLVSVTNLGLITHKLNQFSICKYKVPRSIQSRIPNNITLEELIEFLHTNGCIWISGYNIKSIKYANSELKDLRLRNSL
jgi:hypothetical protein